MKTDERAEKILELVASGLTRRQILQWVKEKSKWQASARTIDRMLAQAHELLEREAKVHRQRELGLALKRLNMLFARCMQITDFKAALAVEREHIALLGLAAMAQAAGPEQPKRVKIVFNLAGSSEDATADADTGVGSTNRIGCDPLPAGNN
jgi:hypothetical protein